MQKLALINHGLLLLLGVMTGSLKIAGLFTMKGTVEIEFKLFYALGFSYTAVVVFGFVQVIAALMLLTRKTVRTGALILAVTFVIATSALLVNKNFGFGIPSIVFIVMAALCYQKNKFTEIVA